MNIIHYNVDKEFSFDRLIIINVSKSISLYCQGDLSDMNIGDTSPEFLARFRRVKYDGSLYTDKCLQTAEIPAGSKIVIKLNGKVGIIYKSGIYHEFNNSIMEELCQVDFPKEELGEYGSYLCFSINNFNEFLDSFRLHTKPVRKESESFVSIRKCLEEELDNV